MSIPTAPQGPSQPTPYPAPAEAPAAPQPTNVLAILSLVFAFVCAPVGIVLGLVARKQIKERGQGGAGLAKAGVILSSVFTALAVLGMVLSVALVGYGVSKATEVTSPGNVAMTRAAMGADAKSMATFQEVYVTNHPDKGGFPVAPSDAAAGVEVGDSGRFVGVEGNIITVTTKDPKGSDQGGGYCVLVTNLLVDSGEPLRYDSQAGGVLKAGEPGKACAAGYGSVEVAQP